METLNIIKAVTNGSNVVLLGIEIFVIIINITILARSADTAAAKEVIWAWLEVSLGWTLRIGYWVLASVMATGTAAYAEWAIEWRWLIIIAAFFVLHGNMRYLAVVKGWDNRARYMIGICLFGLLFLIGVVTA